MTALHDLLGRLDGEGGSDLHLKPGSPPRLRVDGQLRSLAGEPLTAPAVEAMAREALDEARWAELERAGQTSSGLSVAGLGRFRIAAHRQRGSLAMVVRRVPPEIPDLAQLGLPPQVERLATEPQGLVLVTGPPGSGKTTTVAAVIDRINRTRACHILTVEDPIEVLHPDREAMVTQREVGLDADSYAQAVRGGLRADADVLFIGEIGDADTARAALTAAEVGHLVITTMRASGAVDTINRLLELFPLADQPAARQALVTVLRGVVSQRLLERADGRGRVAAAEVLVGTAKVVDCIAQGGRIEDLEQVLRDGQYHGMQTLDQALFDLVHDGRISVRDAVAASSTPEDLRIALGQAGLSAGA